MVAKRQPIEGKVSYELVTVVVRQVDFDQLYERKLPMDVQVSLALEHYLKLIREGRWLPESVNSSFHDGKFRSIRCAVSKQLCDQIKGLMGRFDLHTLQAVRLYLL